MFKKCLFIGWPIRFGVRTAESPNLTYFNEFYRRFLEFDMFWNFFPFEKIIILEHFIMLYGFFALFRKERSFQNALFLEHKNMIKSRKIINDHFLSNDPKSRIFFWILLFFWSILYILLFFGVFFTLCSFFGVFFILCSFFLGFFLLYFAFLFFFRAFQNDPKFCKFCPKKSKYKILL